MCPISSVLFSQDQPSCQLQSACIFVDEDNDDDDDHHDDFYLKTKIVLHL